MHEWLTSMSKDAVFSKPQLEAKDSPQQQPPLSSSLESSHKISPNSSESYALGPDPQVRQKPRSSCVLCWPTDNNSYHLLSSCVSRSVLKLCLYTLFNLHDKLLKQKTFDLHLIDIAIPCPSSRISDLRRG